MPSEPDMDILLEIKRELGELDSTLQYSLAGDEIDGKIVRFLTWFYKRTKAYEKFLNKLYTLPYIARVWGANNVTFYTENGTPITVNFTAYDLVEMVTLHHMLRNEETRKQLVNLLVETYKHSTIITKEGEKELTLDKNKEEALRRKIENAINTYIAEIDKTRGSKLAKHIYLRNQANNPELDWLMRFSKIVTMTTLSLHAKSYILKNHPISLIDDPVTKATAIYYKYLTKFKHEVSKLGEPVKPEEKAREVLKDHHIEDFKELLELVRQPAEKLPEKLIPQHKINHLTQHKIPEAKIKKLLEEEQNITL